MKECNQSGSLVDFSVNLSTGTPEWIAGKTLDEVLDLADQNMYEEKFHHVPFSEHEYGTPGTLDWKIGT